LLNSKPLILTFPKVLLVTILTFSPSFLASDYAYANSAACDTYQVNGGDQAFLMNLNTPLEFGGTIYNGNIYVSPKGTMTFGQGDFTFWDYPQTPSISIASWDYHAFPNQTTQGVWNPGWGINNDLYVRYGSTATSICVDWKVLPWGQSSGNPVYIRMIAEVNPVNYTWTPTYQVSNTAPAGARYGVRYTQGGPVQPLTIQTITTPPEPEPTVPPAPEPTPTPSPTPTPEPTESPTPQPTEQPTPEPTSEPEPQPEPTITQQPEEPEPTILPTTEPEEPLEEPSPSEPTPIEEEPITFAEDLPVELSPEELMEVDLAQIDGTDLTLEQAEALIEVALETFETAEQGSPEYEQALDALYLASQQDDIVLDEELAAIPLLGDALAGAIDLVNALGNAGSDMSPQVRETSEEVVVASVIVGQVATVATMAAGSAPAGSVAPTGGSGGGGAPVGNESKSKPKTRKQVKTKAKSKTTIKKPRIKLKRSIK